MSNERPFQSFKGVDQDNNAVSVRDTCLKNPISLSHIDKNVVLQYLRNVG